ncbi:hypothetical protein NEIELOOT_02953 [Neisseria elongata subsp. glycolytica ATCC 29315]|uniref:Uncharacterized protein n=1 Tax=Neisseria elongata subsp. glycolytica ATCC 29315 TaxID=546263 RepID=D4DV37_NEIEG|nr:hypothetical protein NEIELOOT_02953 [Neisseria elongata subsp. glycolytica ATCC 29315]
MPVGKPRHSLYNLPVPKPKQKRPHHAGGKNLLCSHHPAVGSVCAAVPVFYVRRSRNGLKITPPRKRQWRAIVAANLITCLILLLVWYFWF